MRAWQGFTPDVNGRCTCDPIVSGPGCCFCAVPGTCGPVLTSAQAASAAALVVNLHGVVLSSPGGTVFQPGQAWRPPVILIEETPLPCIL